MNIDPFCARPCALVFFAMLAAGRAEVIPPVPDLSGYRSTKDAVTATVQPARSKTDGQTGYLGVALEPEGAGDPVVAEVAGASPAESAGVKKGDRLRSVSGRNIKNAEDLRAAVQMKNPGDTVSLEVTRGERTEKLSATLEATSRPVHLGERAVMGVSMVTPTDRPGIEIRSVTKDKPAAAARLHQGDRIMKVDDQELGEAKSLSDVMMEKKPGDTVSVLYQRGTKLFKKILTLVADDSEASLPPEERRELTTWKKPVFRIAMLCVEFPDAKHNPAVPLLEWEQSYFSRGIYHEKNATGQQVYGSMADYYNEVSYGKLRVEGKVFDWVEASKKRMEYNLPNKSKWKVDFMNEVVQSVLKRDGADALKGFDGLAFIYAGVKPMEVVRSSILWPHRSSVKIGDRMWPYVIIAEGGERMGNISTMCHEFGHILGLPDLYARPENPGSEGGGIWTVMSNQARNGRPQHFCAWCKEQLGWLSPVVLDPIVKQKLILGPVEGGDHECFKVLVRPDGSEYFLLENRRKSGFDASLPAEGLLIWRVVANRPILEESHGVLGPAGPRVFLTSVPWPSRNNHSFTPYTTPSSRSQMGGGFPVNITDIRQLPDGRVTFKIGYEFE
ncbi:MAG TPA: M6 family metalloprotease domain-containing protein [Verrucomicrobiaceae bacterium]